MRDRISFMTFAIEVDVVMGKINIKDAIKLIKSEGINYIDAMMLDDKRLATYEEAFL